MVIITRAKFVSENSGGVKLRNKYGDRKQAHPRARAVSNLKLLDGNLIISYTSEFKTLAETANEDMGSLSYSMRGNLSLLTSIYYSGFIAYKKGNFVFREAISSLNLSYLSGHFWL